MNQLAAFLMLSVVFQLKHFLADFPLQTQYMLQKSKSDWEFVVPLLVHSVVHALMTLMIVLVVNSSLWWLAVCDLTIHFVMDRFKSGPRYLGRFMDVRKSSFWITLGFDQMVHHLTHLWIIWMLVSAMSN